VNKHNKGLLAVRLVKGAMKSTENESACISYTLVSGDTKEVIDDKQKVTHTFTMENVCYLEP
jgi:hypothetical protein